MFKGLIAATAVAALLAIVPVASSTTAQAQGMDGMRGREMQMSRMERYRMQRKMERRMMERRMMMRRKMMMQRGM